MARSRRSPTPSRQNSSGAGSSTTGNKRGGGGGKNKNKPPPNHPTENDPLHRQNLVRNLRRNDVEMAAIQKVNRTLRQLRDEIVARYGEHTMLDIGEGKIRLKTGEYGTVVNPTVVRVVEGVLYDPKSSAAAAGGGSGGGSPEKKGTDPGSPSQSPSKTKSPGNDDSSLASPAKSSTTKSSEKSPAKAAAAAAAVATPISTIPPDEVPLEDDEEEEQQQEEEEDASSSSSQPNTSRSTRSTKKTDVIRAYLLRYQLRRRLLNRLFRRLNRVSRAMDGASPLTSGLTGPNPPKYGDVHLDVNEEKYAEFTDRYGPMMEARRRVQDARDRARIDDVMSSSMSMSMSVTSEITDMGLQEDDDADGDDDDANAPADSAAVAAGAAIATTATAYDGSSGQSLATICNDVDGVDEADLALLMETEAGYDKVVTYHDMTKAGGGRRGSPTGSGGGGSSSAKKSPSKRSGGFGEGSPIKVESSSAADEVAPASTSTTSGAGSDAAAAAAADDDDDDDAVPPTTPSGKINGVTSNGNGDGSDSSAATAAATNTASAASASANGNATNGDVSSPPAIVQLVPGKIRKTVTFPLAYDDPPDETQDFAVMKYGTGIGAAHRTMNSREREMEYKRWKTDIVSKIPVQPTFAELGLENRVFNLEGRRKRAAGGGDGGGATDGAAAENDGVEEKEEDMMDVDSKEGEEEEKEGEGGDVDTMEVDGEDEKKEGDGDVDGKEAGNDDDHKKKEDGDEAKNPKIFKQKKLISLAAAPSFYSQDLRRIRILHHDLMIRSGFERCKKKVEEAKAAYDRAYKVSTDLHTKKNVAAASLNKFVYMKRGLSEKIRTEHTLLVAVKRNQWQKAHEEWVGRRMAAGLPVPPAPAVQQSSSHTPDAAATNATATAQNGTVHGTPTIAAKLSDSASTEEAKEAASTLGSVVDAVAIRAEVEGGGMTNGHDGVGVAIGSVPTDAVNFPPFVEPPPKPIPESMEGDRQEALLRKSVTDISAKLTVAEEERKRAWRKMLKTKEEYPQYGGGPPRGGGGGGGTRRKPAARATYRAPAAPAPAARAVYRAPAAAPAPAARTAYRAPAASAPAAPSYGLTGAYGQTSVYATGGHALPAAYGGTNYGYGAPAGYIAQHQIPMQQQQQRMRPGVPTAPTGTMAMVAANAATLAAASANAQATVPRTYNAHQQQQTAQALAAYQAQRQQGTTTSAVPDAEGSQSKYSTASVQARTFNDGSVAPTVPPKRGEDGLFLRPTGRARKNMDWDAINGLWVPESGPD